MMLRLGDNVQRVPREDRKAIKRGGRKSGHVCYVQKNKEEK